MVRYWQPSPRMTRFIRWVTRPLYGHEVDAIAVGYTIVNLTGGRMPADLERHELEHVYQAMRLGRLRFWAAYLLEYTRHGYHANRFEKEARVAAGQE